MCEQALTAGHFRRVAKCASHSSLGRGLDGSLVCVRQDGGASNQPGPRSANAGSG